MQTNFSKQCAILADLWMNYRDGSDFDDFMEYNDIGLPLAYLIASDLVKPLPVSEMYVQETFNLLCAALKIPSEMEFENLQAMFELSQKLNNQ